MVSLITSGFRIARNPFGFKSNYAVSIENNFTCSSGLGSKIHFFLDCSITVA
jgi:hypothetical protein